MSLVADDVTAMSNTTNYNQSLAEAHNATKQDYFYFELGINIYKHFSMAAVIFGCTGNIFAVLVMLYSKKTRSSVPGLLLIFLTLSDTLYLITVYSQTFATDVIECRILNIFTGAASLLSGLLVLYISISRYIVVAFPLRSTWILKYRNTVFIILLFIFLSLSIMSPTSSIVEYRGRMCVVPDRYMHVYLYFIITVNTAILDFLISGVITVFSVLTIRALNRSSRGFATEAISSTQHSRRKSEDRHVTRFLLLIGLFYVATHVPYGIGYVVYATNQSYMISFIMIITKCWYMLAYSADLVLYCAGSSSFRSKAFRFVTCWMRCTKQNSTGNSSGQAVSRHMSSIPEQSEQQFSTHM